MKDKPLHLNGKDVADALATGAALGIGLVYADKIAAGDGLAFAVRGLELTLPIVTVGLYQQMQRLRQRRQEK